MCQQCDSVIFTHHHPTFRYHDDFTTLCIASGMPAEIKRFILSRRDASSLKRVKHKLDMDERRVPPIIPWHTHARTHALPFFSILFYFAKRGCESQLTLAGPARDASRRALALRGLRALKFAAGLRADFPFPSVSLRPSAACNIRTAAALSHPVTYTRAAVPRHGTRVCVNPMALTGFLARPFLRLSCSTKARTKSLASWPGSGI